jgi:hypothetical protein
MRTSDGMEAPKAVPQAMGLRAKAPHSTRPATCGSREAQRAATRPENDSATRTGRASPGTSAAAWRL